MTEHNFIIQKINLDDIIINDRIKYNSNNHWTNKMPIDYIKKSESSYTSNWIDLLNIDYKKIIINNSYDLKWMKEAANICKHTGKFTKLYEDELNTTVTRLEKEYNLKKIFNEKEYFIRTEYVSLKTGMNGTGPYYNIKSILESIVSSKSGHSPITNDTSEITLYLLPWKNISKKNEFRVFVYKNNITCISQQHLYTKLYTEIELSKLNKIVNFFNNNIKKKFNNVSSYVYDFAFIDDDINKPYFIEINPFGKEYSSGSALFHWIIDYNILYGKENNIYFRYTV